MLKVFSRKKSSAPPSPSPASRSGPVIVSTPRALSASTHNSQHQPPPPLYARFATRGESFDSTSTRDNPRNVQTASKIYGNESVTRFGSGPSLAGSRREQSPSTTDDSKPVIVTKKRPTPSRLGSRTASAPGDRSPTKTSPSTPRSNTQRPTEPSDDLLPPRAPALYTWQSSNSTNTTSGSSFDGHSSDASFSSALDSPRRQQNSASPSASKFPDDPDEELLTSSVTSNLVPPTSGSYSRPLVKIISSSYTNIHDAAASQSNIPALRREKDLPRPPPPGTPLNAASRPVSVVSSSSTVKQSPSAASLVHPAFKRRMPSSSTPASALVHPSQRLRNVTTSSTDSLPITTSVTVLPSAAGGFTVSPVEVDPPLSIPPPTGVPSHIVSKPPSPVIPKMAVPIQPPKAASPPSRSSSPITPAPSTPSQSIPVTPTSPAPPSAHRAPVSATRRLSRRLSADFGTYDIAAARKEREQLIAGGNRDLPTTPSTSDSRRQSIIVSPVPISLEVSGNTLPKEIERQARYVVEEDVIPPKSRALPTPPTGVPAGGISPTSAYDERRRVVDERQPASIVREGDLSGQSSAGPSSRADPRQGPPHIVYPQARASSSTRIASSPFKLADARARSRVDIAEPVVEPPVIGSPAEGSRSRLTSQDTIIAPSEAATAPTRAVSNDVAPPREPETLSFSHPPTKVPQHTSRPTEPIAVTGFPTNMTQSISQSSSVSSTNSSTFSSVSAHTQRTSVSMHDTPGSSRFLEHPQQQTHRSTDQEEAPFHQSREALDESHVLAAPLKIRKKRNLFHPENCKPPFDKVLSVPGPSRLPAPTLRGPGHEQARERINATAPSVETPPVPPSSNKARPLPIPGSSIYEQPQERVESTARSMESSTTAPSMPHTPEPSREVYQRPQDPPEPTHFEAGRISPRPSTSSSHRLSTASAATELAEPEPTFYPLDSHLLHPELLSALLRFLSFRETLPLLSVTMLLKKGLEETKEVKEVILERFLTKSIGYRRWTMERMGRRKEPLSLTLRDLNSYMRGISFPPHHYLDIADSFLTALAASTSTSANASRHPVPKQLTNQVRMMASSSRAYTRVVVRLRAQAEAEEAHLPPAPPTTPDSGHRGRSTPRGQYRMPATGPGTHPPTTGPHQGQLNRRSPSPAFSFSSYDRSGPGANGPAPALSSSAPPVSMAPGRFRSPLYRSGNAPLLRVFVPSPEGAWLSDSSVVECERELKRAGVIGLLKPGDVVHDLAAGDEGNTGRLIWDGNYLIDLDYSYSHLGEVPHYIDSVAFPPSYFHKIVRTSGNPIVHMDLSPFAADIASHIQLLQDRIQTDTPQGGHHTVVRYVHRARFRIRPGTPVNASAPAVAAPDGSTYIRMIDPGWHGTIVVEAEGTNEGLADLQARVGNSVMLFPMKTLTSGQHLSAGFDPHAAGASGQKTVFRLLRGQSRPGEIWLRCVREKEKIM